MTPREARRRLAEAGVPDAAADVRRLFDHAYRLGNNEGDQDCERPNSTTVAAFVSAIDKRAQRIPVSQIVGGRDFWENRFLVTPDVLDPRPETELLVELALKESFGRVLDLGTGSGCILVSLLLERRKASGIGTDISQGALAVAKSNARDHGVAGRMDLIASDWFDDVAGRFDLIVSNPPYVALQEMAVLQPEVRNHEPRLALTDEFDGLTAYRQIAAGAPGCLERGGRLIVEIGPTQGDAVSGLFHEAGLEDITIFPDLDGRDRVVYAKWWAEAIS